MVSWRSSLTRVRGWCCDGRTWVEHAHDSGECCQPRGKDVEELPPEGERLACERLEEASA